MILEVNMVKHPLAERFSMYMMRTVMLLVRVSAATYQQQSAAAIDMAIPASYCLIISWQITSRDLHIIGLIGPAFKGC